MSEEEGEEEDEAESGTYVRSLGTVLGPFHPLHRRHAIVSIGTTSTRRPLHRYMYLPYMCVL